MLNVRKIEHKTRGTGLELTRLQYAYTISMSDPMRFFDENIK